MNDLKDCLRFLCWSCIDFQCKDQLNLTHLQRKNKGGKLDDCQATHCQEMPIQLHSHKRPPCISVASVHQFGALSLRFPVQVSLCSASSLTDTHRRKWPFYEKQRDDTDAQRQEQNNFFFFFMYESQWYVYSPEWHVYLSPTIFFFIIPHQNRKHVLSSINERSFGAPTPRNTLSIKLITLAYYEVINSILGSLPPSTLMWVFAVFYMFAFGFPFFSIKHAAANHHRCYYAPTACK